MRTPEEIRKDRTDLEAKLDKLEDEEQAWSELSKTAKVAERIHAFECNKKHENTYSSYADTCTFHGQSWTHMNNVKRGYFDRAAAILDLLPDEYDEARVLDLVKACRKQ